MVYACRGGRSRSGLGLRHEIFGGLFQNSPFSHHGNRFPFERRILVARRKETAARHRLRDMDRTRHGGNFRPGRLSISGAFLYPESHLRFAYLIRDCRVEIIALKRCTATANSTTMAI